MRGLIFIAAISLSACSYTPVADLRASGESAQLYQRDLAECKQLVDQSLSWLQYDHGGLRLNKCLEGRGHSIIGGVTL